MRAARQCRTPNGIDMIPRWRNELRRLWEPYLFDREPMALLASLQAQPQSMKDYGHEYPHLHRVCDVQLGANLPRRAVRRLRGGAVVRADRRLRRRSGRGGRAVLAQRREASLADWVDEMLRDGDPKAAVDWERYR